MIPPGIHHTGHMENRNKIIPKSDLKLRKIGNRYMIVEASGNCVNLTNVYSLNGTAARLWETICRGEGCTPEELAEELCKTYEVEYERALYDVENQLAEWEKMGLLVRQHTVD